MVLWGFRWFRLFLNPFAKDSFEHISESDRRLYILERLEGAEFSEWSWVVVVAGVGFFTDAYAIFAINMVVPMLGIIYYPENGGVMPHNYDIALSVLTLGGSIIGQIGFGLAADIWGRRKMYGTELVITIAATLGVVMSSNGTEGSMSVIAWLLVWRFVLGIGIGADYPLSAVICSEFAPTRLRGKMLTAVFMCQPLGQLAATLVTLIATARQRNGIPSDATLTNCDAQCKMTMDSIWRWIIGVGVIPAVIALWFRLTIIESPRYTADVGRDTRKAASELDRYLLMQTAGSSATSVISNQAGQPLQRVSTDSGVAKGHISRTSSPIYNRPNTNHAPEEHFLEAPQLEAAEEAHTPPPPSWKDFKQYFWHDGNLRTLIATSFCWFCVDLPFYGLGMNSPKIITTIWYGENAPPTQIYSLITHNVWQSLIIVSLGAIIGSAITFVAIDKLGRRNIQINGFFWLFILFVVIGGSFNHLYDIGGTSAIIVLYILCQIFFNFGPNTTTYIMPAELFPTRYRGLCHGISAAFGKLGSVVAQLFLAYINYGHGINYQTINKWLPYSLLIFSLFMLLGLLTTLRLLPASETNPDTTPKTLEQWALGRPIPNTFATHPVSLFIARIYHALVDFLERIYLVLDSMIGGDEKERREEAKRRKEEMEVEMRRVEEVAGRRGSFRDDGGGERVPSPFVKGRLDGNGDGRLSPGQGR
ncbi:MFS general substrate transporter [Hyaloscypha variabilis F]|uniref:MFS general substrate transporter n=1 Tax=Hyaloscypha variabilis (strain UAMH 11265 / GT02V1 / F) TaxID=1149755 RepID=A0A2J6QY91_HYAVF|nr:MFS general substrate transporter [Hyaloscypha variabilis F]